MRQWPSYPTMSLHDTYSLMAHLNYVVRIGAVFDIFAAITHWFTIFNEIIYVTVSKWSLIYPHYSLIVADLLYYISWSGWSTTYIQIGVRSLCFSGQPIPLPYLIRKVADPADLLPTAKNAADLSPYLSWLGWSANCIQVGGWSAHLSCWSNTYFQLQRLI